MPTGYTAKIEEGISFKQFVLNCARAFGACIEMRDDPMDKPIPDEFNPSDYHEKKLAEANKQIVKLKAMTLAVCETEAKAEYEKSLQYHKDSLKKRGDLKRKYDAMLAEVQKWNPPTNKHEGLKKFMREQIEESIKYDCEGNYHFDSLANLKQIPAKEWQKKQIDQCLKDISYAAKNQKEENERAASRTAWVRQLRESIG